MSGVSSVSSYSSYSAYSTIAAGGTYTSAAQGATELAMQETTETQVIGLEAGSENLSSAKSVLNIEDSALESISDYLQSIRELSLKALNATTSDDEKAAIQSQIEQYLQGINDIASSTSYNEKSLLDGSTDDMTISSDDSGSTETVSTYNTLTDALGLSDYNVTGDFDLSVIDDALETISSYRSNTGAQSNAIDYALSYNSKAALELDGYAMDMAEDNAIKAYQELKTKQALDAYQAVLQKKQMDDKEQQSMMLFT